MILLYKIVIPNLISQIITISNQLIIFIKHISNKYNIDLELFENYIYDLIKYSFKYISNGVVNIISLSINIIIKTLIIITLTIYFLIDMDKIKNKFLKNKCLEKIDIELNKYIKAFFKIMIISFFEYFSFYKIIGHPNALVISILVSLFGIIPYVGGIITNMIACISAFVISKYLFIKTIILCFILSIVDGYIINPFIYGKSNKIHPMIILFSCVVGETICGVIGIILSIPILIIIKTIVDYNHDYLLNYIKKNKK